MWESEKGMFVNFYILLHDICIFVAEMFAVPSLVITVMGHCTVCSCF